MTLFLHEQHELLHLVVNSIRKDLLDHNELNNCLALHAIANVGGKEMGEALSGDVHTLLVSSYEPPPDETVRGRGDTADTPLPGHHSRLSRRRRP